MEVCRFGFSLSNSDANSSSIRVRRCDRLRVRATDPSARHNAAAHLSALLPAPQSRGGAVSARATAATRASAVDPRESNSGIDIVHVWIVQVDGDDGCTVRQHTRHVGGTVRRCIRRWLTVVAVDKTSYSSTFCCIADIPRQLDNSLQSVPDSTL